MVAAGILDDDTRTELVDGVLVDMNPPGPRHAAIVAWLNRQLVIAAGERFDVRVQDGLLTSDGGYLSPDLMVTEPLGRDRLPDSALLVIEVARSSRLRDLQKAVVYAEAGVPEYWIVDVDRDEVLVHRQPSGDAYASIERVTGGELAPLIDLPPLDVAALLARRSSGAEGAQLGLAGGLADVLARAVQRGADEVAKQRRGALGA